MAIRSLLDGLFGSQGQQGGGGLLGGLLSGAVSGGGSSGGGGILGSLLGGLFKFADGGMVSLAHLPRYASGGALAPDGGFPIMAHPGEIILNRAQQAAVASGLQGPKVTINNNAPGVAVTPQITPEEIIFHIDSRIDANNRRLPGVMSDSAARSW